MKKRWILALVLLAALLAGGCSSGPADEAGTDLRIVSLMPSNTEILFALGLEEKIVGVTDYCNYPPALEEAKAEGRIASLGDSFNINEEALIELEPTLVILGHEGETATALIERLEELNIKTEVIVPNTIEETLESILRLGELTGTKEKAEEIVQDMRAAIDRISGAAAKLDQDRKPRVVMLLDLDGLYVAGKGTLEDELIAAAGGVNAVEGEGYNSISEEALISIDPDLILCSFPFKERILEEKTAWSNLKAVREEGIYDLNGDLINRPGPRLVQGLELLYNLFHPEGE